ncbi:carbohydrate ABC transporter permease [Aureimonas sp. AU22]|uniref:carbohydrate ABC transporter permease n=1 Tax=Aureimonas sp. AU22 TaxID=1638162 RepID=UPI000781FB5E|nr:sugar ABC transporter permease [Aureimonas sp. AU22]
MTLGKRLAPYLFLAPTLVLGTAFFVLPLLLSLGLSFATWNSLAPPRFVGLANYRYLLTRDPLFYASLRNTAAFVGATIAVGVPLALGLALAFRHSRFKRLWRSAFWLPTVTNVVAIAYIWQFLLADPYGLVNRLLAGLGIAGPAWLADPAFAMSALVVVFVWFHVGQDMMLLASGLDGIDEACEEAAEMDGAGPLRVFWYITLPLLKPTILLVVMTNMIKGVGYFALMLVLTGGGPVNTTNVAALHLYTMAFADLRLGLASAGAYILLAIVFAVALLQLRLMRRGGLEAW